MIHIDKRRLHELLLTVLPLTKIAKELGVRHGSCTQAASRLYRGSDCKGRIEYIAAHLEEQRRAE